MSRGGVAAAAAAEGLGLFDAGLRWPRRCWCRSSWTCGAAGRCGRGRRRCRTCCAAWSRAGRQLARAASGGEGAACRQAGRAAPQRSRKHCCSTWSVPRSRSCSGTPGPAMSERRTAFNDAGSTRSPRSNCATGCARRPVCSSRHPGLRLPDPARPRPLPATSELGPRRAVRRWTGTSATEAAGCWQHCSRRAGPRSRRLQRPLALVDALAANEHGGPHRRRGWTPPTMTALRVIDDDWIS